MCTCSGACRLAPGSLQQPDMQPQPCGGRRAAAWAPAVVAATAQAFASAAATRAEAWGPSPPPPPGRPSLRARRRAASSVEQQAWQPRTCSCRLPFSGLGAPDGEIHLLQHQSVRQHTAGAHGHSTRSLQLDLQQPLGDGQLQQTEGSYTWQKQGSGILQLGVQLHPPVRCQACCLSAGAGMPLTSPACLPLPPCRAAVPEALRHQEEAGQEGQAEPAHPSLDPVSGMLWGVDCAGVPTCSCPLLLPRCCCRCHGLAAAGCPLLCC